MSTRSDEFVSQEGNESLIDDDNFHDPETGNWWEHETIWFWWFNPERKLGCWIYHYIRPNIGVAGGGVLLFDDTAWFHMETPYYLNYSNTQLPAERDLRDFTFPGGSRIQMLEPLQRYRLSFADRDTIRYDLDWQAIMPPWVRVAAPLDMSRPGEGSGERKPRHLDQFGHVTGQLVLHGEEIPIDCLAMRDRSWWHLRPEPWKSGGGRSNYITAAASPETAFFGCGPGGFLVLDGVRKPLVRGSKRRERDPEHGFVRRLHIEAVDTEGRELEVEGESVSRMAMPISGAHGVCWQSLMRYTINGIPAWGDDQDAWPIHAWSAFRRRQRGIHDSRAATLGDVFT
jgi:hypothetical protein